MSKNVPTNKALYNRVKAEAKRKFDRWPSAYGSAWLVREYKKRGGKYRKAEEGMEVPDYTIPYMAAGGKMPQWLADARFSAAGNEDKKSEYGYHFGGIVTPKEQMEMLQEEQMFMNPFEDQMMYGGEEYMYGGEEEYKKGGGIPQRYKNKGFTRVGVKKKSTRPGKKWMVLAKKGDKYKIVHGGDSKMKDFKQHGSTKRKKRFWDRMGGRDSAKAKDPFSPLYWHKRFGTWEAGGETFNEDSMDFYKEGGWIQEAVKRMEEKGTVGAFTKQANRAGYDSVQAFATHVLNNEDKFSNTTVKRAQFAKNVAKSNKAKYGMELPKFQGRDGSSEVSTTSGMGSMYMNDLALENDLMYREPTRLTQLNPKPIPTVFDYSTYPGAQIIPTQTLIDNMEAEFAAKQEEGEAPETETINWVKMAGQAGLGLMSALGRRAESKRQDEEFRARTAADNVYGMRPQGMPGDRGDFDTNYGFFRPDEMGFKNDARYWNPYVAQATYRAEQGGELGMVDEELLQELIAAGADIELLD